MYVWPDSLWGVDSTRLVPVLKTGSPLLLPINPWDTIKINAVSYHHTHIVGWLHRALHKPEAILIEPSALTENLKPIKDRTVRYFINGYWDGYLRLNGALANVTERGGLHQSYGSLDDVGTPINTDVFWSNLVMIRQSGYSGDIYRPTHDACSLTLEDLHRKLIFGVVPTVPNSITIFNTELEYVKWRLEGNDGVVFFNKEYERLLTNQSISAMPAASF